MTNLEIDNAYVGSDQVERIYLGADIVWERTQPTPPEPVYSAIPLTFEIISGGTISWMRVAGSSNQALTIEYSLDDGDTWTSIKSNTGASAPGINVSAGDKVQIRGNNRKYFISSTSNRFSSSSGCRFKAYGNIMSLTAYSSFTETNLLSSANTSVFKNLFYGCSGITTAEHMVFSQNTVQSCYESMFSDCSNLTTGPELPADTVANYAYEYMFRNCGNLKHIKCLATNLTGVDCTANWVNSVSETGTFVKHPNMTSWTTGISGIPVGWTVQDYCLGKVKLYQDSQSETPDQEDTYCNGIVPQEQYNLDYYIKVELEGITRIDSSAFASCVLTSVTLDNWLKTIGYGAFMANSLSSVTIPESVTAIGDDAFFLNNDLTQVIVLANTPPSIGSTAFGYGVGLSIYVKDNLVSAYQNAWTEYSSQIHPLSDLN